MHARLVEKENLQDEFDHIEQQARMLLPGMQAIFGFQLIACFNAAFKDLSAIHQDMHLAALILMMLSIFTVMTPAAYHRLAESGQVSQRLVTLSTRLLMSALVPMMLSISIEIYIVTFMITKSGLISTVLSIGTFFGAVSEWFIFPLQVRNSRRHLRLV